MAYAQYPTSLVVQAMYYTLNGTRSGSIKFNVIMPVPYGVAFVLFIRERTLVYFSNNMQLCSCWFLLRVSLCPSDILGMLKFKCTLLHVCPRSAATRNIKSYPTR